MSVSIHTQVLYILLQDTAHIYTTVKSTIHRQDVTEEEKAFFFERVRRIGMAVTGVFCLYQLAKISTTFVTFLAGALLSRDGIVLSINHQKLEHKDSLFTFFSRTLEETQQLTQNTYAKFLWNFLFLDQNIEILSKESLS